MAQFWQGRVVPYFVGAQEFLFNVWSNISESWSSSEVPPTDFSGKVCLITGANAGIGRALAAAVVQRGGTAILACRSLPKAELAAKEFSQLRPLEGCQRGSCQIETLDLAALASVKSFTRKLESQNRQLDYVFCNAGIMAPPARAETADGLEYQFQVNYLGHWRMVHDLVAQHAKLRHQRSSPADIHHSTDSATDDSTRRRKMQLRVVWLTSMTHVGARLDLADLQLRQGYSGFRGYANSKLASILAVREFQRRVNREREGRAISAVFCAVHPGLVDTDLARGWLTGSDVVPAMVQRVLQPAVRLVCPWILVPPERALHTLLYAATAPAAEVEGKYIAGGRIVKASRQADDLHLAAQLWDASCQLSDTEPAPCYL